MPPKLSKFPPPHPDSSQKVIEAWSAKYFSAYAKKRQNEDSGQDQKTQKQARIETMPVEERHKLELMERDPGHSGFKNNAKFRLEYTADMPGTRPFLKVAESFINPIREGLKTNAFFISLMDLKVESVTNAEMCKNYNLNKCNIPTSHYPPGKGPTGLGTSRIHGCVICYVSTGVIFGHQAINCRLLHFLDKKTKQLAKLAAQKKRQGEAKRTAATPAANPENAGFSGQTGTSGSGIAINPSPEYNASPLTNDENDTEQFDEETTKRMSDKLLNESYNNMDTSDS